LADGRAVEVEVEVEVDRRDAAGAVSRKAKVCGGAMRSPRAAQLGLLSGN